MFSRRSVGEGGYGRRWKEESPPRLDLFSAASSSSFLGGGRSPYFVFSLSLSLFPLRRGSGRREVGRNCLISFWALSRGAGWAEEEEEEEDSVVLGVLLR